MAAATERIPIVVTKTDKTRFSKKAKSLGFESISDFARTAMDRFRPTEGDDVALSALFEQVKVGTRHTEQSLDQTIAYCDASNQRMEQLAHWMRQKGYTV